MRRYHLYIALAVLVFTVLQSCKKQLPPPDFCYEYFDLTEGRYIDYDVTEIAHDVTQAIQHDTLHYQLRTLIGDTIIDNEGRIARKYYRFKRNTSADSWVQSDLWTAIISENRAELVEENQRIIKLVFAPTLYKEWNPNAFNMYAAMDAYYRNLHKPGQVGAFYYDSTLRVELDSFISLIDYKRKYEVYAKGVGLVYKYWKDLKISGFDTLNVQSGKELFYRVIGYGIQ